MNKQTQGDNRSAIEQAADESVKALSAIGRAGKAWRRSIVALATAAGEDSAVILKTVGAVLDRALLEMKGALSTDDAKKMGIYDTLTYAGKAACKALGISGYFKRSKAGGYEFVEYTAPQKGSNNGGGGSPEEGSTDTSEPQHVAAESLTSPLEALEACERVFGKDAMLTAFASRYAAEIRAAAKAMNKK